MPARKTTRRGTGTTSATKAAKAAVPAALTVSAAVAGAARRRAARQRAERAMETEPSPARRTSRASAVEPPRAARKAKGVDKRHVKKVLDKGVSKADQLMESAMKWVVKLAIRAKSLYDMLHAWWNGKFDFPTGTLQAILVALLYFLSPFDVIPDVLPLFGLMDDAAVFAFVFHKIRDDLEAFAAATGKDPSDLGL